MNVRTLILGAVLGLGMGSLAHGQDLIDGSNVDDIVNIARGYGSANLATQDAGEPKIEGKISGINYVVYFMNCTDAKNCEDLDFYVAFPDVKVTMDAINAWNRDKRFGKAYLDADLDAAMDFDVNLEHGVSRRNMDAAFAVWALLLDQYSTYIGYESVVSR